MSGPTARPGRAPLARFYEMGGRLLAFRYHGEEAARPAENFLASFHLRPVRAAAGEARCTVDVFSGQPAAVSADAPSFEVPRGVCRVATDGLHLDIDGSRIVIRPAESVEVRLGETEHARHPVAVVNALSYAVQGALRRAGLFDLHAACAVEPRTGGGLLVAGPSGSGKSSLTIRLASAGWGYLTDDMLTLRAEAGGPVRAHAFRRAFSVSERSLEGAGRGSLRLLLGPPVNSDPSKRSLDPAEGFPGQFVESCVPRVLCFAELTGEAVSRLERLSQAEAMRRLVVHSPWASYDRATAREHLGALARLAAQCRGFRLAAGRDLAAAPPRADELLAPCFADLN
jgi:hypothetical protein